MSAVWMLPVGSVETNRLYLHKRRPLTPSSFWKRHISHALHMSDSLCLLPSSTEDAQGWSNDLPSVPRLPPTEAGGFSLGRRSLRRAARTHTIGGRTLMRRPGSPRGPAECM